MTDLLLVLFVFIAFHIIPAIRPVRRFLVNALGMKMYVGLYSAVSVGRLVLVGFAYADADSEILWMQWPWTRWVPVLTMPLACLFLVSAVSEPNPLSVGVKGMRFEPARPGTLSITRHPLLWGLLLWAGAHLFPNGDTASLVLFGLFLGLSLAGLWSVEHKKRKDLGAGAWAGLANRTSIVPFVAILSGRARLDFKGIGPWRVVAAALLYTGILHTHELVIGVSPFPT